MLSGLKVRPKPPLVFDRGCRLDAFGHRASLRKKLREVGARKAVTGIEEVHDPDKRVVLGHEVLEGTKNLSGLLVSSKRFLACVAQSPSA